MKHLKKSNLPYLPKRPSSIKRSSFVGYFSTIIVASWLGTYLDLYFVGKQIYSFPKRPFPELFSINIGFTLVGLPLLTFVLLAFLNKMVQSWKRGAFIIILSLLMSVIEMQSEAMGWFIHNNQWHHYYSFCGYLLFLTIIWKFYKLSVR